jgi:hypothetical protein
LRQLTKPEADVMFYYLTTASYILPPRLMLRYTDGEAGFMDARRVVDRMFVAGLHPDWASVSSLLDTVSQDSRNGTCMMWQIDQVAIYKWIVCGA